MLLLLSKAQFLYQFPVLDEVSALQILEQAPALAYEYQQAAAGIGILLVDLEMIGELGNALGEECYLDFG